MRTASPQRALGALELAAYAALAFPLAMAALPVYLQVPRLYGATGRLSLGVVGGILLAARTFDAIVDPLCGYLSDCAGRGPSGRQLGLWLAVVPLGLGLVALFHPPAAGALACGAWLTGGLLLTYFGFSLGSISYYALGAELSADPYQRTRVTAARGTAGVAGLLVAAVLPEALGRQLGLERALGLLSLGFLPVLLVGAGISASSRRSRPGPAKPSPPVTQGFADALAVPLRDRRCVWLLLVSLLSGLAAAIPGTLLLFFVADVLRAPDLAGVFLGLYFLCAVAAMPLWLALSRRAGKHRAWLLGMLAAVAAFGWAYALGPGDALAFAGVCALSGAAYGAELALPPSILADLVDASAHSGLRPDGAYFGLWQMTDKLSLALAAGTALPLLEFWGYQPGVLQAAGGALSATYSLVPCAVKLAAVALLVKAPLGPRAEPDSEPS